MSQSRPGRISSRSAWWSSLILKRVQAMALVTKSGPGHRALSKWRYLPLTPAGLVPLPPLPLPPSPLYPKSMAALPSAAQVPPYRSPKGGFMKFSSIATLALAFVSIGRMFAADPPPWAYGFEGPPQAGATTIPVGPANTDQTPRSIPGAPAQYSPSQPPHPFGP